MSQDILQIKVSLVGVSKPPVWRRLLVPASIRLDQLHTLIQIAMGWSDYHLHVFTAGAVDYGPPDPEFDQVDERRTSLADVIGQPGDRMRYVYDFGDDWQHDIVVEKLLAAEPGTRHPRCIAGKGACPPEDCGGAWGYAELRAKLADPSRDDHADMLDWLGLRSAAEFDPAAFEVAAVNALL